MADHKDIAAVIQSALTEIGVSANLDVEMDGKNVVAAVGGPSGDDADIDVTVVVEPHES